MDNNHTPQSKRVALSYLKYALIVAAVVGAGFGAYRLLRTGKPPAARFETAKVERGRVVARVTATGTLSALVTVQVGAQVSGRIAHLYADFNTTVKKGQVIARIDPQLFVAAVNQSRANLLAAEGNLAKARAQALDAKRQATRSRSLRQQSLIAQADADTAESNSLAAIAQVQAARGAVEQAKAQLHTARINLDYTTIVSPIDGVVISRNVDVGQTVAAALQAPTLFTIAEDLRKMQVDTNVAEADVGRLKAGGVSSFTVDAYPGEKFRGTIRQIRNAPQTLQNVVTYDAVIDVPNPDLRLKPGMTANVTFVYAEKEDVLRVTNAALRFRPPAGAFSMGNRDGGAGGAGEERKRARGDQAADQRTVWVLPGGAQTATPTPHKIRTGVSDGSVTEVTESDLAEGDVLVTEFVGDAPKTPGSGPPAAMRRGL